MADSTPQTISAQPTLDTGTYELLRRRMLDQATELSTRLDRLNAARQAIFGASESRLLATRHITTENNCIPRDMAAFGQHFLFGYNVHIGLRAGMRLEDVFSLFRFEPQDHSFHELPLEMLRQGRFEENFRNLFTYYKDTTFARFALIGPSLFMVFQTGKQVSDIKTFKWTIREDTLVYEGDRFDHEYRLPEQFAFTWKRTGREMQRRGIYPHISIEDRLFVECIGGDLTIKVEDNTDTGLGIYAEPVEVADQTLDDAEISYALAGNLIVLKIRPYQEKQTRYIVVSDKLKHALRVDALEQACVLLPESQGIIFPNGYYLQTGAYKLFDKLAAGLQYEKRIQSAAGEDFLYVFSQPQTGEYVLMPYNLVAQQVTTPVICHGYSLFDQGELCFFRAESEPGRHHVIQVWHTPYGRRPVIASGAEDSYIYKVGSKDLVRGMAECRALLTLAQQETPYDALYADLVHQASSMLDAYYWLSHPEAGELSVPLAGLRDAAAATIEAFESTRRLQRHAQQALADFTHRVRSLLDKIRRRRAESLETFVGYLTELRTLRGEAISLRELRYADTAAFAALEAQLLEGQTDTGIKCATFLADPASLTPYAREIEALKQQTESFATVAASKSVQEAADKVGSSLSLLTETVGNLPITDTTESTRIVEQIAALYAALNGVQARIRQRRTTLQTTESSAAFFAQMQLLAQSVTHALDTSQTPEACEASLGLLTVQLEELEGKFGETDTFLPELTRQREEIHQAFESRRLQLLEARNKRVTTLMQAAERLLDSLQSRAQREDDPAALRAFFASDLLAGKVRTIMTQLEALQDAGKADDLRNRLRALEDTSLRALRDRKDLASETAGGIRLGRHTFSVVGQPPELSLVPRDGEMYLHLTGTRFFEKVTDPAFLETRATWEQVFVSENTQVYRAEYLAWQVLHHGNLPPVLPAAEIQAAVRTFAASRYEEGYVKGVHDQDAALIYTALREVHELAGALRYLAGARALALLWWERFLPEESRKRWLIRLEAAALARETLGVHTQAAALIAALTQHLETFATDTGIGAAAHAGEAAAYLLAVRGRDWVVSKGAATGREQFEAYLKQHKAATHWQTAFKALADHPAEQADMVRTWVQGFVQTPGAPALLPGEDAEIMAMLMCNAPVWTVPQISLTRELTGLQGEHPVLNQGHYTFSYPVFTHRLRTYEAETVPVFRAYQAQKTKLLAAAGERIKPHQLRPQPMASFVRNQLIDKVYLPLIGDNLAKQIGTSDASRADRMGMLLVISPPGYGKTTLIEYVAHRLGLIFLKVNGPALGREVTSLDPAAAPNAAAREELERLNLAWEIGDNVMLYLDDIQHCNPEFLQKFISLCDAQRKIEGVYRGVSRTYDLRGRRFAVVMAGNPYTESGEAFSIPDMLANRADTYNLGDILGNTRDLFGLSYLENAITSNPVLQPLGSSPPEDLQTLFRIAATGNREGVQWVSNIGESEVNEAVTVLQKLARIRDVVMLVNQAYIQSAAQAEAYRTEPRFLMQGSYRNMNKMAEKVLAAMNDTELDTLILSHYTSESQTLTRDAEANLLKCKMICGYATPEDEARWQQILETFRRNHLLSADRMGQIVQQLGLLAENLAGIRTRFEAEA
ncbi:MAG: DNA repair ATPase [Bacteroidia bacterium]|nr:DNA repair ATPase [Bacteroidia bacterium]